MDEPWKHKCKKSEISHKRPLDLKVYGYVYMKRPEKKFGEAERNWVVAKDWELGTNGQKLMDTGFPG